MLALATEGRCWRPNPVGSGHGVALLPERAVFEGVAWSACCPSSLYPGLSGCCGWRRSEAEPFSSPRLVTDAFPAAPLTCLPGGRFRPLVSLAWICPVFYWSCVSGRAEALDGLCLIFNVSLTCSGFFQQSSVECELLCWWQFCLV